MKHHVDNIEEILGKIEDIRSFFKVGKEIIPFLGDLFIFLQDIMPLMSEINTSLHDSNRTLPTASRKISSATKTTEMATHDILDKLENISEILPEVQEGDEEKAKIVIDDVNEIIMALQFQDITTQQLDHAERILEAIFKKTNDLFESIDRIKMDSDVGATVMKTIEKSTDRRKKVINAVKFNEDTEDKMRHEEKISQDDIDSLFG